MTQPSENKTSDAVRITRIVVPAVVLLALAFLFKGELGGSMQRGCFELKLETAGIDLKDQSLCTANDVNKLAETLTEVGANEAEELADSAFQAFEKMLLTLSSTKDTLLKENLALQRLNAEMGDALFYLARKWEDEISIMNNPEAQKAKKEALQDFIETFNIPTFKAPKALASVSVLPADSLQSISTLATNIRASYHKKTDERVLKLKKGISTK